MTSPASPPEPASHVLDAEAVYARLLAAIDAALVADGRRPALVGVHSGGAWVAGRLQADLAARHGELPLGVLSSAFHRDDYAARGLRTSGGSVTRIDFPVEGADLLLVDDILFTGRTVRAALNELFDYGRPRTVRLAVLLDRGGRELPFQADFVGQSMPLPPGQAFALGRGPDGRFTLSVERA